MESTLVEQLLIEAQTNAMFRFGFAQLDIDKNRVVCFLLPSSFHNFSVQLAPKTHFLIQQCVKQWNVLMTTYFLDLFRRSHRLIKVAATACDTWIWIFSWNKMKLLLQLLQNWGNFWRKWMCRICVWCFIYHNCSSS